MPITSYLYNTQGSPLELVNLMEGPNGLTLIHYPPLRYYVDGLFFLHTGVGAASIYFANLFWWSLLCVATFLLGRKLGKSNIAGALALALGAFSPDLVLHVFAVNADLPATAMVILTAYLVVKSDYYQNRSWSIIVGILAGLSALTRPTTLIFIVLLSLGAFWVDPKQYRKKGIHLVLAGAIGFAVMMVYYGPLFHILIEDTTDHFWPSLQAAAHHFKSLREPFHESLNTGARWLIFGCVLVLGYRKDRPSLFLMTWAFGSLCIFLFMRAFGFEQLFASLISLGAYNGAGFLSNEKSAAASLRFYDCRLDFGFRVFIQDMDTGSGSRNKRGQNCSTYHFASSSSNPTDPVEA